MNKACLANLSWQMSKGGQELWCKFLNGKYRRSNEETGLGEAKTYHSSLSKKT